MWSPRCSWTISCRRCSYYNSILDLTPGFNGLDKDSCKTRWETFKFWDLVHLISNVWQYICQKALTRVNDEQIHGCITASPDLTQYKKRMVFLLEAFFMIFGWVGVGGFSKVVAIFSHVGRSFNLFMTTTRDVWIIPSFRIGDYVLHVEHISCVIINCGQHQWVIPSLSVVFQALLEENITRKLLSIYLDLFLKIWYSRFLSIYSFLSLYVLLTFFWLVCYCSLWLYFSQGTS